jgi:hypothetical protein
MEIAEHIQTLFFSEGLLTLYTYALSTPSSLPFLEMSN